MKILRVLNNNVVLATDGENRELVLTGRGLGFQAKAGQAVPMEKVVRTFAPTEGQTPKELAALIGDIPPEHIALAVDALEIAREDLGLELRTGLVVPLADHLSFALKRVSRGLTMDYPLGVDVAHLYPRELNVAQKIIAMVNERGDVELPAEEAVSITLHLINAAFATADIGRTYQMTDVILDVLRVVEKSFDHVDLHGVAAARFITHLRYFFVRLEEGAANDSASLAYSKAIFEAHMDEYQCALRVAMLLELRMGAPITEEEIVYLTMHIARMASDGR